MGRRPGSSDGDRDGRPVRLLRRPVARRAAGRRGAVRSVAHGRGGAGGWRLAAVLAIGTERLLPGYLELDLPRLRVAVLDDGHPGLAVPPHEGTGVGDARQLHLRTPNRATRFRLQYMKKKPTLRK